ncbi:PDZK1-interacting protein 1 isoform 1-T1 [Megaptera novaeangliae]
MTAKASLSGLGSSQGRPGLAHYHGREGRFPPPSLLRPPSPPSFLAPLLQGQTETRLISTDTDRPHGSSRSPDSSGRREGPGAACSHVCPRPGHPGPAHGSATHQRSTREPVNMVLTVGNKADGILVGTDGKYSSMEASFRSSEHENAYENNPEEEGKVRSTPM